MGWKACSSMCSSMISAVPAGTSRHAPVKVTKVHQPLVVGVEHPHRLQIFWPRTAYSPPAQWHNEPRKGERRR